MNKTILSGTILSVLLLCSAQPAFAQWPAGTPREDTGARPSPMGNPTPMEKMETYREDGKVYTEDGREVRGMPEDVPSTPNRNLHHTEVETIDEDPPHHSASPGEIE